MAASWDGYFLVFLLALNKSKNLVVILLTLNKSKETNSKTAMGETGCLCIFFVFRCLMSPALHPGFSDLWGSPPALSSTLRLGFFCFVFECIGIQFFNSPREAEDFPRGDNHSKHVPLPTYLAWLQPIYYNSRFVFIHINTGKAFICGENFDKKYRASATLISNHQLLNNCSLKKYTERLFFYKISLSNIGNNNKFFEYFF